MMDVSQADHQKIGSYIKKLTSKATSTFLHLQKTWSEVGIPVVQQEDRFSVAVEHILTLMRDMCEEEDGLRNTLIQSVEAANIKLVQLSKELGIPPYQPDDNLTTLLELEEETTRKVNDLTHQKQERLLRLEQLQEEESPLAKILNCPKHPSPAGSVPTLKELEELQQNIDYLRTEKDRRFQAFQRAKTTILAFLADLELSPLSEFERDVVCEDDALFVLSQDNLASLKDYKDELEKRSEKADMTILHLAEKLKLLWDRLDVSENDRDDFLANNMGTKPKQISRLQKEICRCEGLKRANIGRFIEQLRGEVEIWQEKCFVGPDDKKSFHHHMQDHDFTEDLLNVHEKEVTRLREYYEENQDILNSYTHRENAWREMLEYESRANDPDRFKNRGGNLLQEENRRKRIIRDLTRLDKELTVKVADYESRHGSPFMVNGHKLTVLIADMWDNYEQTKENEKAERQRARARRVEDEALNGTKPCTPSTANKNSSKRKLPQQLTPGKNKKKTRPVPECSSRVSHLSGNQVTLRSSLLECDVVRDVEPHPQLLKRTAGRADQSGARRRLRIPTPAR